MGLVYSDKVGSLMRLKIVVTIDHDNLTLCHLAYRFCKSSNIFKFKRIYTRKNTERNKMIIMIIILIIMIIIIMIIV